MPEMFVHAISHSQSTASFLRGFRHGIEIDTRTKYSKEELIKLLDSTIEYLGEIDYEERMEVGDIHKLNLEPASHLFPLDFTTTMLAGEKIFAPCGEELIPPLKFGTGDLCIACLEKTAS